MPVSARAHAASWETCWPAAAIRDDAGWWPESHFYQRLVLFNAFLGRFRGNFFFLTSNFASMLKLKLFFLQYQVICWARPAEWQHR
jgi:hypothetical protein